VTRSWWRGPGPIVIAVVGVLAIVSGLLFISQHQTPPPSGGNTQAAQIAAQVQDVPASVSAQIGAGGVARPLDPTGSATLLKDSAGLPMVIYIGADYCPFCAAERWSLVLAMSRFGQLSNLSLGTSSSTDSYPNTATFSFTGAKFQSSYVDFSFVETTSRSGQTIASPTAIQQSQFNQYDSGGSIPFIDVGSRFVQVGSGYAPDVLQGMNWTQIVTALGSPGSAVANDVVGNANWITAAICVATANQPASACSPREIVALEKQFGG